MATKLNVIDVSRFNPSVDWTTVAGKVDGVIIRAGYRGTGGTLTTDPKYLQYLKGAINAGIKRIGVYWWTAHTSTTQAEGDAAYLLNLIKPYKDKINFGVWLDSEASPSASAFNKLSSASRTTCALAFLSSIREAGFQPGVYASDSWFVERLIASRLTAYPFWVAKYSTTPPKLVKSYVGWQYTGTARMSGISGEVDKSWFYTDMASGKLNAGREYNMDTLRKGDSGQQVRALQKILGGLTVDGDFGPLTKAAVEAYQRQYGLDVDGVVGPKTWGTLLA